MGFINHSWIRCYTFFIFKLKSCFEVIRACMKHIFLSTGCSYTQLKVEGITTEFFCSFCTWEKHSRILMRVQWYLSALLPEGCWRMLSCPYCMQQRQVENTRQVLGVPFLSTCDDALSQAKEQMHGVHVSLWMCWNQAPFRQRRGGTSVQIPLCQSVTLPLTLRCQCLCSV